MKARHTLLLMLAWLGLQAAARAEETLVLTPIKDSTLIEESEGRLGNSVGPVLFVGRTGQPEGSSIRRAVIAFDVAGTLPEDAIVIAVELTLTVMRAAGGGADQAVALHRVVADWGEGGSSTERGMGMPSTAGDATWVHRHFDTAVWSEPGGDFTEEASAVQSIGSDGTYSLASSSASGMVGDVQFWLENADQNFGWLLKGDEQVGATVKVFASRETDEAERRPTLTVTFESPP